jgi:hypothetical protein
MWVSFPAVVRATCMFPVAVRTKGGRLQRERKSSRILVLIEALEHALLFLLFRNSSEGFDWLLIAMTYVILDRGDKSVDRL